MAAAVHKGAMHQSRPSLAAELRMVLFKKLAGTFTNQQESTVFDVSHGLAENPFDPACETLFDVIRVTIRRLVKLDL